MPIERLFLSTENNVLLMRTLSFHLRRASLSLGGDKEHVG
jgi:hypothetical protein